MVVFSVSRATADWTAYSSQKEDAFAYCFLLLANHCMNLRNKKSKEGARRQIIGSANQSAFPEDKKSDRPIRLLWQDIQVRRTNHILRTDLHTDQISVSTNQILRTDLPTDHLSLSSNQILWSVISRNIQEINSFERSWTTRMTRAKSPSLSTTQHSNNLRSHERDGRNWRKKLPRAKAVRSRTH